MRTIYNKAPNFCVIVTKNFVTHVHSMNYRYIFLYLLFFTASFSRAQDTLATKIDFDLSTEVAVGTGNYTAYQLTANRHHSLATRPNTANFRAGLFVEHQLSKDWKLSGGIDAIASVHADHKAYLQQCYANLSWKSFFLEAGSKEEKPAIRDENLSIGSFTKGTNAKPVPQIHVGTKGFWDIPYTKGWVQANFDFGYGKFLDSGYREDKFYEAGNVNRIYSTGFYYHQKHLFFRSNPEKLFFGLVGIEHVVQFCGVKHDNTDGTMKIKERPISLKEMFRVLIPIGDATYFENNEMEDWRYGNHIGMMTYQIGWNINKHHQLQAYLDNPFEDGSGIRKGNGWDGLWGIQYTNKAQGIQYVRGAVLEYFQSTNQCGPLHWDGNDYPEPIRSQITDKVVGNDDYYNHEYYGGYSHYGMTPGIGLIVSPKYNRDGFTAFRDNRIKAWHLALNGDITNRLSYLVKGSYQEGWGTFRNPLSTKHHSFDAIFQGIYQQGPWEISAAYAFDKGNIYGDCSTFNFKIRYHGKIL